MKLWVDDLRRCPDGWTLARNNTEAIRLLATGYVEEISVDHDICVPFSGELSDGVRRRLEIGKETFQPVAYYLSVMPESMRPLKITFHTANPDGAAKMMSLLKAAGIESTYVPSSYAIDIGYDLGGDKL
jgi:hypothetical protein